MSGTGAVPTATSSPMRHGAMARPRVDQGLAFAVAMLIAAAVLGHFFDHFWWAPDEGVYAHVAERVLRGEVLNGTVQDIHMGYVTFANALALKLFGLDLVSLRYPLVGLTLIQCALVFWLLAGRGKLVALAGVLGTASLSFVQFLNPSAHWYALFLCVVVIALLATKWSRRPTGLAMLGFLLVSLFLFRQLSGIFAAIGVFTFLLLRAESTAQGGRPILSRLLALVMLIGLAGYLATKSDPLGAAAFAGAPLLLLLYAALRTRLGDRDLLRCLLPMILGGIPAVLPLLAYHLHHGSLVGWFDDTVVAALSLTRMDFMDDPRYYGLVLRGLFQIFAEGDLELRLNGLFWIAIPLLPPILGLLVFQALRRSDDRARLALPVVACFYAPVSLHYQIPLYLFFSTGLTLAAILFLAAAQGRAPRYAALGTAFALSCIGLVYQAGQPISRNWDGIIAGTRSGTMAPAALPHASLVLPEEEAALYRRILAFIRDNSGPGDSILAVPVNPELYFLTDRSNPLRDPNVAIGLHSDIRLAEVERILGENSPRIIFFQPKDKYVTPRVERLMEGLRRRYRLAERVGDFEIYLPKTD